MQAHKIVHIEISATDHKALSKFYADVFGWTVHEEDGMNYTTFRAGDGVAGGFNPVNDQYPAGTVTFYIESDDVTASLNAVKKAGGTIVAPEMEIPNTGKFGMFRDPQGNLIGIFKAYPMPGQRM